MTNTNRPLRPETIAAAHRALAQLDAADAKHEREKAFRKLAIPQRGE